MAGLSEKQEMALPILATHLNIDKACEEAGIGRNTFYEWKRQPAFRNELKRIRYEIAQESLDIMKMATRRAAATLVSLLGEEHPAAVRRAAANDILSFVSEALKEDRGDLNSYKMGLGFIDEV